jgi:cell division inhibitor SepF
MGDGLLSKFKSLVGFEDIDDEYEDEIEEKREERISPRRSTSYGLGNSTISGTKMGRSTSDDGDNILSMQKKTLNAITAQFKIIVIEPKGFDECPKLVDNLKSRKPVIINLEKIETDTARKIFDFLSGATYALNGNVQKIANNIFVFLPENVDVATSTTHKGIKFGEENDNPWR